ncbi:transcription elongation factor spt5 [Rhizophlyctis rosea]|nr:transcription elongation factor spt5 [Rhizophlyctis rosea]
MSDDERETRERRRDEEDIDEDEDMEEDDDRADDDEEEDEEEEEEEEEEEDGGRPRKRRRRPAANPFIETEAAVEDDDEEEEEEEEGYGLDRDEDFDEEAGKTYLDSRVHREIDRRHEEEQGLDEREIAARMQEKYGRQERAGRYTSDYNATPKSFLLPTVNDSSQTRLWMAKCKPGKERDIVWHLMNKFVERRKSTKPIDIHSVFYRDGLAGYIYLEAFHQAQVAAAIENVPDLYGGKLTIVQLEEMPACLTIKTRENEIKPRQWVRVKRGIYQGDLGRVLEISDSGDMITVQLIPRFDLDNKPAREFNQKRKKMFDKPPAKLLNIEEHKHSLGGNLRRDKHGGYTWKGERVDLKGYLEKDLKLSALEVDGVTPTLEELAKFQGGELDDRADGLEALADGSMQNRQFQAGESVEVISGDLMGTPGTVESMHGSLVTVRADTWVGLKMPFQVDASTLRKRFKEGDHVKVVNGSHKGQTGMVVGSLDNIVTILSDSTMQPVKVFAKDLRPASDVSASVVTASPYAVNDLAVLSPTEAGVVLKVEPDIITLLNNLGQVMRVKPGQIKSKRDTSKKIITNDRHNNPFQSGDAVIVNDPANPGNVKRGNVLHIYRTHVFVHSRDVVENNGIFVTKTTFITAPNAQPPRLPPFNQSPGQRGGFAQFGGGGRGGAGRGRGRFRGLVGKTVTISGGEWKGYVGMVKDVAEALARVELHTAARVVKVPFEQLNENGRPVVPKEDDRYSRGGFDGGRRYDGGGTPSGAKTPMYGAGARTPMYRGMDGGTTPYTDHGSRTPAWDSGSRTPHYRRDDSGGRTPAWDSGSRTPGQWDNDGGRSSAWDVGSRTPARPGATSEYSNPFTPAHEPSMAYQTFLADSPASGTPYNASSEFDSRPTPQDPATPYNPNTPGPYNPNTPGPFMSSSGPATPAPATPFGGSRDYMASGGNYADIDDLHESNEDWVMPEIEVEIVPSRDGASYGSGELDHKHAVVIATDGQTHTVKVLDSEETVSLPLANLKLVVPDKKDPVKVVGGRDKGLTGAMLSKDDNDGVVRLDGKSEITIFALKFLGKRVVG